MHITLLQTSLSWQSPKENLAHFKRLIEDAADTNLIMLPEMFTTGFSMHPHEYAHPPQEISDWMLRLSKENGTAICGSAMVKEGEAYYNRFFFCTPQAEVYAYNKKHLFTLAKEEQTYTAGQEQILIEYQGWRIKPMVCYDLRFPVWSRNTEDYDLLIYVANWPARRSYAWKTLLPARAIENMAYVAGVNRVGEDGNGVDHSGDSAIYDPLGKVVAQAEAHAETPISATLDKDYLQKQRKRYGFLKDADSFSLLN